MKAMKINNKSNKMKLKKSIKKVICRPDPVHCPLISHEQAEILKITLSKYKIVIPHFEKLHWNELKCMPKEKRPKPPKLEKIPGFIFGLSECCEAINKKTCSAIVIESEVNPKLIIQATLEACSINEIPVVCVSNLRKISKSYFGIKTICLGIRKDFYQDIQTKIIELANQVKISHTIIKPEMVQEIAENVTSILKFPNISDDLELQNNTQPMATIESNEGEPNCDFTYLYRCDKNTRTFQPKSRIMSVVESRHKTSKDYISISNTTNNKYKEIKINKIVSNPNRKRKRK